MCNLKLLNCNQCSLFNYSANPFISSRLFASQNLERAYLTHPFHCCAFKFPSRHDPVRHEQQIKLMEEFMKCKTKGLGQNYESMRINESDVELLSRTKRRLSVRLIRSGFVGDDNETMYSMATTSQDFSDDSPFINDVDGTFHQPLEPVASNNSLEALCGELSGK